MSVTQYREGKYTESVPAPYMTEAQSLIISTLSDRSLIESEVSPARSSKDVETKDGAAVPLSYISSSDVILKHQTLLRAIIFIARL
jgi:hypothetical protein